MKDRFYLACFRDNVGSNISWHAKDGRGYVTDISKAHVYTRDEAQKEWDYGREFDQPISADHVDDLAYKKVDFQYIPGETTIPSDCYAFVAYEKNRFDGNDVFWITSTMPSLSFDHHQSFNLSEIVDDKRLVFIPYSAAKKAARYTFEYSMYNAKVMTQGAGLKTPDRIKRERRRKQTHLNRWNCPGCGRISWQENPYDFDGCKNATCDEFRYY